jgi:hypothetical protein
MKTHKESAFNKSIEATGNNLGGFSEAGFPCASFRSLHMIIDKNDN